MCNANNNFFLFAEHVSLLNASMFEVDLIVFFCLQFYCSCAQKEKKIERCSAIGRYNWILIAKDYSFSFSLLYDIVPLFTTEVIPYSTIVTGQKR